MTLVFRVFVVRAWRGEGVVVVVATILCFQVPFLVQRFFLGFRATEEDTKGSRHLRHVPWLFITEIFFHFDTFFPITFSINFFILAIFFTQRSLSLRPF